MLFHSSVRKELSRSFGASLVVLFTIVVTMLLIRTLGQASVGSVDPQEVMLVLGYTVLGRLPIILTMALFIAVVSVLSRMYTDSEMVIWMASGQSLPGLIAPVLRFAWPLLTAIALLVLVGWPWANSQVSTLRDRFEQRSDLKRVAPGQFQEALDGRRVFFIDKDTADGTQGRNVFISSRDDKGETTISAQSARIIERQGEPFLQLSRGQRLDASPDLQQLKVSEFEEYSVRIGDDNGFLSKEGAMKDRSTLELMQRTDLPAQAELGWRLGLVACAFNFVLLAVATTVANPRAGRGGNMGFAVFAFLFYYNLLNLGETWVNLGKVSLWGLMLGLHGGALALTLAWLYKRHRNVSLRTWWRKALDRTPAHHEGIA